MGNSFSIPVLKARTPKDTSSGDHIFHEGYDIAIVGIQKLGGKIKEKGICGKYQDCGGPKRIGADFLFLVLLVFHLFVSEQI